VVRPLLLSYNSKRKEARRGKKFKSQNLKCKVTT